jgi:deoxyribose-phosphate aldolase
MRATVSPAVRVKAAGGVRTLDALLEVMSVGADRCGATRTAEMLDDYRARMAGAAPAAVRDAEPTAY